MEIIKHGLFEDVLEHHRLRTKDLDKYEHSILDHGQIVLLKYVLPEGHVTEEHFHDWLEFTLILSGKQRLWISGREMVLSSGDFVLINYNQVHHSVAEEESLKMTIQFRQGYLENLTPKFQAENISCSTFNIGCAHDYYLYKDLIEIYCYMFSSLEKIKDGQVPDIDFYGYLNLFLYRLFQVSSINRGNWKKDCSYIQQILYIINKRYSEPITLNDLAEEMGLNPDYISRLIKNELGIGYKKYLTRLRT